MQEGVRKTITEFELKAVDADTEVRVLPQALAEGGCSGGSLGFVAVRPEGSAPW